MLLFKKKILFFRSGLFLVSAILCEATQAMECKEPLLSNESFHKYDSLTEPTEMGSFKKPNELAKHQSESHFLEEKCSLFERLPLELITMIFNQCDPRWLGLNYLIHHYEPVQEVVDGIVRSKMSFLLERYYRSCSHSKENVHSEREKMFDELFGFQKNFPVLYSKCQHYLSNLLLFEKFKHNNFFDCSDFKVTLSEFICATKSEAARLEIGSTTEPLLELTRDIFAEPESDDYLAIHRLYLEHIEWLLSRTYIMNITTPPCWKPCLVSMSTSAISFFVLNVFLTFFSTSFDFEYKNLLVTIGTTNTFCSVAWMLWAARLCKKTAVPGYRTKKMLYKELKRSLKKAFKELDIGPQDLVEYLIKERENIV